MKDIQAIAALYEQVDNYLETLRDTEETAGGDAERDRVTHKQRINDQAYFVVAWGQLEAEIEEACRMPSVTRKGTVTGGTVVHGLCTIQMTPGYRA